MICGPQVESEFRYRKKSTKTDLEKGLTSVLESRLLKNSAQFTMLYIDFSKKDLRFPNDAFIRIVQS